MTYEEFQAGCKAICKPYHTHKPYDVETAMEILDSLTMFARRHSFQVV